MHNIVWSEGFIFLLSQVQDMHVNGLDWLVGGSTSDIPRYVLHRNNRFRKQTNLDGVTEDQLPVSAGNDSFDFQKLLV